MKTNLLKASLVFILMTSGILYCQNSFTEFLDEIARNSPELVALKLETEKNITNANTGIFPANPEIEYRMSKNNESEFGITQSFHLPNVYIRSMKSAQKMKEQQEAVYLVRKTEILLAAQKTAIHYNWLQKQVKIATQRLQDSKNLLNAIEKKLATGNGTQLEVNRAKRHLMSKKVDLAQLESNLQKVSIDLKTLNGNEQPAIPKDIDLPFHIEESLDSLETEFLKDDKLISLIRINYELAEFQVKQARNKWLPTFQAGIHTEGSEYDGPHFGISLPLWENKNVVKEARLNLNLQEKLIRNTILERTNELQANYKTFTILQQQLSEMKPILDQDKSENLLIKALDSGELNVIDYLQEIEDIYENQDLINELNFELQTVYADLIQFRL